MIYFISGHRDITQEEFDANYVPAIEDAIDNGQTTWEDCEFIVGDCKGCDQMAAEYIAKYIEENMDDWDCVPCTLTIHHMFSEPRFRVGTKADDGNYYIDVRERFNEGVENESDLVTLEDCPQVHYVGGYECDTDRDSAMTTFSEDMNLRFKEGQMVKMTGINKYLFLDVDGVLNSVSWYREEWNKNHVYPQGDFDPKCVELVNRIVEETGCKVVVSSSWRTESNLQSIFDKAGLKFKIHSITPFGSHRGCEIQEWLDSQTEPYVYAILDDDRDMLSHQRKYFIKTNTVIGITDEDARHIINILNRNNMWNDKLNAMIADSMKKHDTTRTNVYRAIKTAFTNYAAAKNAKPLDEAAEISIIKKMRDERWANAETYQTAGRMDLSAAEADEAEILEELLPKEPTKEELNAALLKLALDKGWYDEEHNIHPVQIPKNQMGIAVKELKAKYPAADGKKIADLVKANLCD